MAEVQTSTQSGELSQRFIEFVMMQAQQASLFLGRLPHPQSGQAEIQLEPAKLFIDHLEMIREKTRGNLTAQEADILNSVLSDLQMAFVQARFQATSPAPAETAPASAETAPASAATAPAAEEAKKPEGVTPESAPETESKKKFSKSYGP
jgi:Domain of unknown function (DUF1844)